MKKFTAGTILICLFSLNVRAQTTPQNFHFENVLYIPDEQVVIGRAEKEISGIESQAVIDTIIINTDSSHWKLKYYTSVGWNEPNPLHRQNINLVYKSKLSGNIFTTDQILEEFKIPNLKSVNTHPEMLFPRGQFQVTIITDRFLILKFVDRYLYGNQSSHDHTDAYYFEKTDY